MGNTNLVTNPSFETTVAGGWTYANATAAQDTTVSAGTGSFSSKLTASTPGAPMSASYPLTGLTVGQKYTASFYVRTSPAKDPFSVIATVDGAGSPAKVITKQPYFQRRQYGFIASATTATLRIQMEQPAVTGDIFWLDRVMVTDGPPGPYFDGDYPYSSWTGTAHASTSQNSVFSSAVSGDPTTDEVVVINGLCLNTLAWNITTKGGRYTLAPVRGEDLSFPGTNGKIFVPNKPIDSGTWTLTMYLLGQNADGTLPGGSGMRAAFEHNLQQLLRQVVNNQAPVTAYVWHPNGAVRTTKLTLIGAAPDISPGMGGRRAEIGLAFETLSGVWSDYLATTVTGTPSAAWSNQTLALTGLAGGTVAIDDATVTVTGPITNPRITNADTGVWVQYTGTVAAGSSWVVNSSQWTSKVGAASVLTNTTHGGHPRFVLIGPGDSINSPTLTLTGSGTTAATNLSVTATRKHWYA